MELAFRNLFETRQLLEVYRQLPSNLIFRPDLNIKSQLSSLVAHDLINRDTYKEIYREARAIKKQHGRTRSNQINRYPKIQRIQFGKLNSNVDDTGRGRYVRRCCEMYVQARGNKSNLTACEIHRLAGFLCGLNGAALMDWDDGDGTSRTAKRIQSVCKRFRGEDEDLEEEENRSRSNGNDSRSGRSRSSLSNNNSINNNSRLNDGNHSSDDD